MHNFKLADRICLSRSKKVMQLKIVIGAFQLLKRRLSLPKIKHASDAHDQTMLHVFAKP